MIIAFNDASLSNIVDKEIKDAGGLLDDCLKVMKELNTHNLLDVIVLPEDFWALELIAGYSIADWKNDNNISRDHKRLLMTYMTNKSIWIKARDLIGELSICCDSSSEIVTKTGTYLKDHEEEVYLLSVKTSKMWEHYMLEGNYRYFRDENYLEEKCSISNISTIEQVTNLLGYIRKKSYSEIFSGQDLWDRRQKLFPNLVFCKEVKNQLFEDSEKYHLLHVMEKLEYMQSFFEKHHENFDINEFGMNARSESESVKKDLKLRNQRLFTLPDGQKKHFYLHISFTGKYTGGRIYFYPDVANDKCYIGYIGRHLDTKKY